MRLGRASIRGTAKRHLLHFHFSLVSLSLSFFPVVVWTFSPLSFFHCPVLVFSSVPRALFFTMFTLFLAFFLFVSVTLALPTPTSRRFSARNDDELSQGANITGTIGEQGTVEGTTGLGDISDLLYTVPIQLGNTSTLVDLGVIIDTGSSDLWVITSDCVANACANSQKTAHVPAGSLTKTGANVTMRYGDSTTGTFASGPVAMDTVSIAGVAIENQLFGAINETTSPIVQLGAAGILGLGFPTESQILSTAVINQFGKTGTTDHLVASSFDDGPLLARIAQTGALEMPMFTVSLQRSTIDVSGTGALTLGKLPDGIDNSSLTWVPVRLYSPAEGGISAPTFAPDEVYPLRWEIDLEGVFLDGVEIAPSTVPTSGGVNATRMSALIDTGNSILRGPSDVVSNILGAISPSYTPDDPNSAISACAKAHNLAFKIGGQMFPIDPRDLPSPVSTNDASTCMINKIAATDAPGPGALFRWNLGDPFIKSNLVAFHFGNLTHPSQDPPRIGFLSQVPTDAANLLAQAAQDAVKDGGKFESVPVVTPDTEDLEPKVTVVAASASLQAAELTATRTPAATPSSAVLSDNKQHSDKSNAAPRMGIWDSWLIAVGGSFDLH
ncbi:Peptidase A1 domain-containing protein [Mycena venus]|uniref:Peptidase A1 domain-containing protein n=1 Tax=Mycena venus TaxID=2733690 RepID=A0A8H7CG93_9AGAR|nr:Peptidase A1 domain-containing protein [Mycena venus]